MNKYYVACTRCGTIEEIQYDGDYSDQIWSGIDICSCDKENLYLFLPNQNIAISYMNLVPPIKVGNLEDFQNITESARRASQTLRSTTVPKSQRKNIIDKDIDSTTDA